MLSSLNTLVGSSILFPKKTPFSPPTNLTIYDITETTISIQYDSVPDADNYVITTSPPTTTINTTSTSYTLTGLTSGVLYTIYVRSQNTVKNVLSSPVSVSDTTGVKTVVNVNATASVVAGSNTVFVFNGTSGFYNFGNITSSTGISMRVLSVAGGGGGGAGYDGGGGGGGGGVVDTSFLIQGNNWLEINMGAGGVGGDYGIIDTLGSGGSRGGNTTVNFGGGVLGNVVALGGGAGGEYSLAGSTGGSGGGAGYGNIVVATGTTTFNNRASSGGKYVSGGGSAGGGGAGAAGTDASGGRGGAGGAGYQTNITGSSLYWGGGGGGVSIAGNGAVDSASLVGPSFETLVNNNYSVLLNGTNQYLDASNNYRYTSGTIEIWIRNVGNNTSYRGIMLIHQLYGMYLLNNVLVVYDWKNATTHSSSITINDGKWHHVALSFQLDVINGSQLYYDGKPAGSPFTYGNYTGTYSRFFIGYGNSSGQYFSGYVDDARVWSTVRTDAEILANYDRQISPTTPGLVAYWLMNEGSGTSIVNQVPGGETLLFVNSPTWSAGRLINTLYSSSVYAPSVNKIYSFPASSATGNVLVLDVSSSTYTSITNAAAYKGAVYSPNGKIYALRSTTDTSTNILVVNTLSGDNITTITGITNGSSANAWENGVLAPNGNIYFVPRTSTSVLIVNSTNDTASTSTITGLAGANNWMGGVLGQNGKIYCAPLDSSFVMTIDTTTNTANQTAISVGTGTDKWNYGVAGPNGEVYFFPRTTGRMLAINTYNDTVDSSFAFANYGAISGVLAPNGKIYAAPHTGSFAYTIDPMTNSVGVFDSVDNTGIVFNYGFNEISGTNFANVASGTLVYDASGFGGASITRSDFRVGTGALNLVKNSAQYVSVPSFTTTTNGITVCFWFKHNSSDQYARIFDFGNGSPSNNILYCPNAGAYFHTTVAILSGGPSLIQNTTKNVWHFFAWTIPYVSSGNTTHTFYFDGSSATVSTSYPPVTTRTKNYIGQSNWTSGQFIDPYIDAQVDDFRWYNRVLSAAEINYIYLYTSKYYATVAADNGIIYGVPYTASQFLRITPTLPIVAAGAEGGLGGGGGGAVVNYFGTAIAGGSGGGSAYSTANAGGNSAVVPIVGGGHGAPGTGGGGGGGTFKDAVATINRSVFVPNGTVVGTATFTNDCPVYNSASLDSVPLANYIQKSMYFDGTTYIALGNASNYAFDAGTYECLFKVPVNGSGVRALMAKAGVYGLYLDASNRLVAGYYDSGTRVLSSSLVDASFVNDNAWHHAALTFTKGYTVSLYLDRTLKKSSTVFSTTPLVNFCLSFNLSNYVTTGDTFYSNYTVGTLEAWIKVNTLAGGDRIILGVRPRFLIYLNEYRLSTQDYGGGAARISTVDIRNDTNWHHIALVFNFGTTNNKLYFDGVPVLSNFSMSAGTGTASNFEVGATSQVGSAGFSGYIDDVRIWDISRNDADILADYNTRISPNTPGLRGYWLFNENTGGKVANQVSGGPDLSFVSIGSNPAWAPGRNVFPSPTLTQTTSPIQLGADNSANRFTGSIANARVWNTVRSAADISANRLRILRNCDVATDGLHGSYPLNDVSSNIVNHAPRIGGYGGSGAVAVSVPTLNIFKKNNYGLIFRGSTGAIQCAAVATEFALNTGTIDCWIKTASAGSGLRALVVKPNAYGLYLNDGVVGAYDFSTSTFISSATNVANNQWRHIRFIFNDRVANGSTLYVDQSLKATFTYTLLNQSGVLGIRNNPASTGQGFLGQIYNVRIWNYALTSFTNTSGLSLSPEMGLVGSWPLNEGINTAVYNYAAVLSANPATMPTADFSWNALLPADYAPTQLAVVNITETTATLNFQMNGYAVSYDITTVPATSTWNITNNEFQFTGLTAGTNYTVNVYGVDKYGQRSTVVSSNFKTFSNTTYYYKFDTGDFSNNLGFINYKSGTAGASVYDASLVSYVNSTIVDVKASSIFSSTTYSFTLGRKTLPYTFQNGIYDISASSDITNNRAYNAFDTTTTISMESISVTNSFWQSICWSAELNLLVAVSQTVSATGVMVSSNGTSWQTKSTNNSSNWHSVCWSKELYLFVAVAYNLTGDTIMTSSDGNTWIPRTAPANNTWLYVCWSPELMLFVAVGASGTGNRVMTSSDGINWFLRSSAQDNTWTSVCWSAPLSLFVAVSNNGTNRVMTSSDGIVWVPRTASRPNSWQSVCWSDELGIFVAVSLNGDTGTRVMTSSNGINWVTRQSAADNEWMGVTWSPELGLFMAVARTGTNRVMISPDGINWSLRLSPLVISTAVCWSPELGRFFAVSNGNTVLYSSTISPLTTYWESSSTSAYVSGVYTNGTARTIIQDVGSISGEWVQIKLPYQIRLKTYQFRSALTNNITRLPKKHYLVGSNDGTTWYSLDYYSDGTNGYVFGGGSYYYFTKNVSTVTSYSHYRIAVNETNGHGSASLSMIDLCGSYIAYTTDTQISPIRGMNANTFTATSYVPLNDFQNGVYDVSASSSGLGAANVHYAFDSLLGTWWSTAYYGSNGYSVGYTQNPYDSAGNYVGGGAGNFYTTVTQNAGTISGEYIQLKTPYSSKLTQYRIQRRTLYTQPRTICLLGSNDQSTWTLLSTQTTTLPDAQLSATSFGPTTTIESAFNAASIAVSADNNKLFIAIYASQNKSGLYNRSTNTWTFTSVGSSQNWYACAMTPDGRRAIVGGNQTRVYHYTWDDATGRYANESVSADTVTTRLYSDFAVSADGNRLVAMAEASTILLATWDNTNNRYGVFSSTLDTTTLTGGFGNRGGVGMTFDGSTIVYGTTSPQTRIAVWNGTNYSAPVATTNSYGGTRYRFLPDNKTVIMMIQTNFPTFNQCTTAYFTWNGTSLSASTAISSLPTDSQSMHISGDGRIIYTCGATTKSIPINYLNAAPTAWSDINPEYYNTYRFVITQTFPYQIPYITSLDMSGITAFSTINTTVNNVSIESAISPVQGIYMNNSLISNAYILPNTIQNGVYDVSASSSSVGSGNAYLALDGIFSTLWRTDYNQFNGYTQNPYDGCGNYVGGGIAGKFFTTITQNAGTISGEYIQIKTPYASKITKYRIQTSTIYNTPNLYNTPREFSLLGSNDGTTWNLIDRQTTDALMPNQTTFSVNTNVLFNLNLASITCAALSADNTRMFFGRWGATNGSCIFDRQTNTWSSPIFHTGTSTTFSCAMPADGNYVIYGLNSTIYRMNWSDASGQYRNQTTVATPPNGNTICCMALTADGSRLVIGLENNYMHFAPWNAGTSTYTPFTQIIHTIFYGGNAAGRPFGSLTDDGTVLVFGTNLPRLHYATWDGTTYNVIASSFKANIGNCLNYIYPDKKTIFYGNRYTILNGNTFDISFTTGLTSPPQGAYMSRDGSIVFYSGVLYQVSITNAPLTMTVSNPTTYYTHHRLITNRTYEGRGVVTLNTWDISGAIYEPIRNDNYQVGNGSLNLMKNAPYYLTLPAFNTTLTGFSTAFWVRGDTDASNACIFDFGQPDASNVLSARFAGGIPRLFMNQLSNTYTYNIGSTSLVDNSWNHIAWSIAPSTGVWTAYLNNIPLTTGVSAYPTVVSRTANYIGKYITDSLNTQLSPMYIDDFRTFNSAIDSTQVANLYYGKTFVQELQPLNLTILNITVNPSITLSFTANPSATTYEILTSPPTQKWTTTNTTITLTGLSNSTTYTLYVYGLNDFGNRSPPATITVTMFDVPNYYYKFDSGDFSEAKIANYIPNATFDTSYSSTDLITSPITTSNPAIGTGALVLNRTTKSNLVLPSFTNSSSGMSLSTWFKSSADASNSVIFDASSATNVLSVRLYGGRPTFFLQESGTEFSAAIERPVSDGSWNHLLWNIDSSGYWYAYVNGLEYNMSIRSVTVTPIDSTSATITYSALAGATSYQIRTVPQTSVWTTTSLSQVITGLNPTTTYRVLVSALIGTTKKSQPAVGET